MSVQIWTPGAAGPLDEFVNRVERMVTTFMRDHALDHAEVRIELADGSQYALANMLHEPGFGFFSFTPHREEGDEPRCVVVPIGAVKAIEISAPDPTRTFGFAPAE